MITVRCPPSSAPWMAAVSSATPSPIAPRCFTFTSTFLLSSGCADRCTMKQNASTKVTTTSSFMGKGVDSSGTREHWNVLCTFRRPSAIPKTCHPEPERCSWRWVAHAPPRVVFGALAEKPCLVAAHRTVSRSVPPARCPARAPATTRGGACATHFSSCDCIIPAQDDRFLKSTPLRVERASYALPDRLFDAKFLQHFRRRAVEACERNVADIAERFPTGFRAVVSAGGQRAELLEEGCRFLEFRFRVCGPADVVGDGALLFVTQHRKVFCKTLARFVFEPLQAGQQRLAILLLRRIRRAQPFVEVVGHAHFARGGTEVIRGEDQVGECDDGLALRWSESQRPEISGSVKLREVGI